MKISDVTTYLVGNPWKNWLFVRVDTDDGVHGVGEGTVNGFSATVQAAIHELRDASAPREFWPKWAELQRNCNARRANPGPVPPRPIDVPRK